jgi:pimeloyl-ACP methyl ester carboxylesterase
VRLELNFEPARGSTRHPAPVIFVHGAWHAAWTWEHWLGFFAERGWDSYAPSLRGHGDSDGDYRSATLDDYVADVRNVIARVGRRPILVGHSLGGLIIQHLLATTDLEAVVLISSVPPRYPVGVLVDGVLRHPIRSARASVSGDMFPLVATDRLVRSAFFTRDTPSELVAGTRARLTGASVALFRDMVRRPAPAPRHHPPALVVAAAHDRALRVSMQRRLAVRLGAELTVAQAGHDVPVDTGWRRSANTVTTWLAGLTPPAPMTSATVACTTRS